MKRIDSILDRMHQLVDELLVNMQQIKDVAQKQGVTNEVLLLQAKQEEKLARLVAMDDELKREVAGSKDEDVDRALRSRIREKILIVRKLNDSFLTALKIKQGLVKQELEKIREQRKNLGKLEKAYAHPKEGKNVNSSF